MSDTENKLDRLVGDILDPFVQYLILFTEVLMYVLGSILSIWPLLILALFVFASFKVVIGG